MKVTGTISRRDLALIFARAADLGTDNTATSRLGKKLLEKMLARSAELVRDEAPPPAKAARPSPRKGPPRGPDVMGFDLTDLTRSMDGVLAHRGAAEESTDPLPVRRQKGRMGLETLQELFVRGGQVRFEGYLEELEQTLEELFERFRSASREFGITIEDLEKGNILGDVPDLLESRRAERKARRGGADLPSSGRWPTAEAPPPAAPPPSSGRLPAVSGPGPSAPRAPSGRHSRPEPPAPPRAPSGRHPRPEPAPAQPAARAPSGRYPRPEPPAQAPSSGRWPAAGASEPPRPQAPRAPQPPPSSGASVIGEPWPEEPGVRVTFARPGVFTVHCACGKERAIDTRSLPPWRIRCTSCRQVLFDPTTTLLLGEDAPPEPSAEGDPVARFLRSSAELTELKGSLERCARHPAQVAVATCNSCARKLCRACLDQVGNAFACASCQEAQPAPAVLPPPPALERAPTAAEVRRAFERALLMAAQEGDLERPGASGTKRVRLIYDHQRRLFKVPLELPLQPGDRLRLSDGRQLLVRAVRDYVVDGVPCYQEVAWMPLG